MTGWSSKLNAKGNAHYLEEDGVPACQKMRRRDGTPLLAPFKCAFTTLRSTDRFCTLCLRRHAGVCRCGRCTANNSRAGKEETQ